jgi:hypothetical protein
MQLMVECLLSMHKALGLISSTSTTKQKKSQRIAVPIPIFHILCKAAVYKNK